MNEEIRFEKQYYKLLPWIKEIPSSERFLIDISVKAGDFVVANKEIIILNPQIHGSGIVKFSLPFNCRIDEIIPNEKSQIKEGDLLLRVTKMESNEDFKINLLDQNLKNLTQTEVAYIIDDFTDKYSVKFSKISNSNVNHLKLFTEKEKDNRNYLGISLMNLNGILCFDFHSTSDTFSLAKGDEIIMLFEDSSKINITFNQATTGQKHNYSNISLLTIENLKLILDKNFVKLKITSLRKSVYEVYTFGCFVNNEQYENEFEGQLLFKEMAKLFVKCHINNNITYG